MLQQHILDYLGARFKRTNDRLIKLESYFMTENLIISGLNEEERETEDNLYDVLNELFGNKMSLDMSCIHDVRLIRTGNGANKLDRIMLVFISPLTTVRKLFCSKLLYINDYLSLEIDQKRRILRPILNLRKELNKTTNHTSNT